MHAAATAIAVRRERQKRLQRKVSEKQRQRRCENGSRRPSEVSQDVESGEARDRPKEGTSVCAFHLGIVFIILGFLMIFSSMIPANVVNADWSRLLGVGITFLMIGLIMVMVNRILSAREEEELQKYVSSRLARTRSGHLLHRNRDVSVDFNKLVPPNQSSRRPSYRDRPGSIRSVNKAPSPSTNPKQNATKNMERSSSVRRSIRKPSPQGSISSTTGPFIHSNISRSNSQRSSRYNLEVKNSLVRKSSMKEDFRGRTSSMKNGHLPTVLVSVTDSNNSSSMIILGPETSAGSAMR